MPTLPPEAIDRLPSLRDWLNEPAAYDPAVPRSGRRTYTINLTAYRLIAELVKPLLISLAKEPAVSL
jgi:hypothetical protein